MITQPRLEDRPAQAYAGIRTQVPMSAFTNVIPQLLGEVYAWLEQQGVAAVGAPFMRFHVIDMAALLDVELGVPVASAISGDGHVAPGVLPAGRYGVLVYTGVRNGIKANKALLDWATAHGIVWDTYTSDRGDGFGARYESYLTDPADEPKQAKWETEVAIRVADGRASDANVGC